MSDQYEPGDIWNTEPREYADNGATPRGSLRVHTEPTPAEVHARTPNPTTMSNTAPVVKKTGEASSWKTTVAGLIAAISLVGEELGRTGWPEDAGGWIVLLGKAIGPLLIGLFARDYNVSSEGKKVVDPNAADLAKE